MVRLRRGGRSLGSCKVFTEGLSVKDPLLRRECSSGWHKTLHQAALAGALRSNDVVEAIDLHTDGRIEVQTISWQSYWDRASQSLPGYADALASLAAARSAYIRSNYDLKSAAPYCWAYFRLLRNLLDQHAPKAILHALIGLGSFSVRRWGDPRLPAAAAITVRHPVYLLAKLREPKAYDDPKFLALVCPAAFNGTNVPQLFYYYRQIKIEDDPPASLLVYPAVDMALRTESFGCIEALASALSFKPDPRSRQRAAVIADQAIAPFLAHDLARFETRPELSFVDIGGGSGSLLSEISKRLIRRHGALLAGRKFAWSIVDVMLQDATRRVHHPDLRRHMSYIEYQPETYATWIEREAKTESVARRDIVLICRMLNNLSQINIECTSIPSELEVLAKSASRTTPARFDPVVCLQGDRPDCRGLVASNGRTRLRGGTTFRQASLSDYFRGLLQLTSPAAAAPTTPASLFFPLRRFQTEALYAADRSSILDRLCAIADMVVIEDVDLTPELLGEHLRTSDLHQLAASNATGPTRGPTSNLLCVVRRELAAALPGERIW